MASGGKNIIIELMHRRSSFVSDTIQHFGIQLCAQVPHADDVEGRGQHDDEAHESEDAGALRGLSEDAKEYTKKLISQAGTHQKVCSGNGFDDSVLKLVAAYPPFLIDQNSLALCLITLSLPSLALLRLVGM